VAQLTVTSAVQNIRQVTPRSAPPTIMRVRRLASETKRHTTADTKVRLAKRYSPEPLRLALRPLLTVRIGFKNRMVKYRLNT
jgi:hypothetical protein